jgi:type IV pilus assembly protein PilX
MHKYSNTHVRSKQRGISLFVVVVLVMLSMLLALWGSRTAFFNEMIVGNDADYQRAFEAAQALMQDAEFDIRNERPDGSACVPGATADTCRPVGSLVWFPVADGEGEFEKVLDELATHSSTGFCSKGICRKRTGNQDFWNDKATLDAMLPAGARYHEFTNAEIGTTGSTGSNPILKTTTPGEGGWYWIEILPYLPKEKQNSKLVTNGNKSLELNLVPNFAYRITAVARGLKPSTQVVLQSTFVRQKVAD